MEPENPGLEVAKAFVEGAAKEGTNKLSEFLGGLVPFWGLKKKAVDAYVQDIKQSNLSPEAKMMAIANTKKTYRELKNQSKIIEIAQADFADGLNIDTDSLRDNELILRLIDSSKFVSDEDLQLLWGKVLAGELEHPGNTPKNIVRIMSELSKENATAFYNLCSLQIEILADTGSDIEHFGREMMVFLPSNCLQEMNINLNVIEELEQLGLINLSSSGYSRPIPSKYSYIHIAYGDHVITASSFKNGFPIGQIRLTRAGHYISRFSPVHYNQQHMEEINNYLVNTAHIEVSPAPGIRITERDEEGCSYERQSVIPPQAPGQQ